MLKNISTSGFILFCPCVRLQWRHVLQVPESHKKGVSCITGIMVSESEAIFASTSSDGTVSVWEVAFPANSGGQRNALFI